MESPINFLTLHREPVRHQYFPNNQGREPLFDPIAKTWLVTNPAYCKELISSNNLRPATSVWDYQALEKRLGLDFSSLAFACEHIPLCLHGDPHARVRRRMSEYLASRKAALSDRIPVAVARHFAAIRRPGRVEIMGETIVPLVLEIMSAIVDIDLSGVAFRSVSVVFDKTISITKRRKIAAEMATLREVIAHHLGSGATKDDVGLRLALLVLGRDPLTGALGESIYRLLSANPGRRLLDIAYPELPPETGVPVTERLVVTQFKLGGCDFAVGDRVRLFLQSLAYVNEPRAKSGFFGGGAHSCLGRSVSVDCWKSMAALMSLVPLRASVISYAARDSDYIFMCPERLEVDLAE